MGRYDTSPTETWDVDVSKNKGFPYTFKFAFDRENNRNITKPSEAWDTDVAKTGRYGVKP